MELSSGNHSDSNSDLDGWTLVSPAHSSNSSSTERKLLNDDDLEFQQTRAILNDGLTEIDLRQESTSLLETLGNQSDDRASNSDISVPGFQALDSTDDDDSDVVVISGDQFEPKEDQENSSRSSLTQSELGQYVDFGATTESGSSQTSILPHLTSFEQEAAIHALVSGSKVEEIVKQLTVLKQNSHLSSSSLFSIARVKDSLDELSYAISTRSSDCMVRRLFEKIWSSLILLVILMFMVTILELGEYKHPFEYDPPLYSNETLSFEEMFDPTSPSQTDAELIASDKIDYTNDLELFERELKECIKRQSPSSYKHYAQSDKSKYSILQLSPSINISKNYRKLVCYGHEHRWRERFSKFEKQHGMNLRKHLDMIKFNLYRVFHPNFLLFNQVEYLDYLDEDRNKKKSENTLRFLKAENAQLRRRLNEPNDRNFHKLIVNLEMKNSKLQSENEALKAKLVEKAGSIYMKKYLESERYERENSLLRQFHNQISRDISKSLRYFNLNTVDVSNNFDNFRDLNAKLTITKGQLRKLIEKVDILSNEKEELKDELIEAYNSIQTNNADSLRTCTYNPSEQTSVGNLNLNNGSSRALVSDNCIRNLIRMQEQSSRLEKEVERLKLNCTKQRSSLQKFTGNHLNVTNRPNDFSGVLRLNQIMGPETGLNRRLQDGTALEHLNLKEMMAIINNFTDQLEYNHFGSLQHVPSMSASEPEMLIPSRQIDTEDSAKIIPNYIREAMREVKTVDEISNKRRESVFDSVLEAKEDYASQMDIPYAPTSHCSKDAQTSDSNTKKEVVLKRGTETSEPINGGSYHHNLSEDNTDTSTLTSFRPGNTRDTWFFKRAKQRKQLRSHHQRPIESILRQTNWSMKRAKLRSKLRKQSPYLTGERDNQEKRRQQQQNSANRSHAKCSNVKSRGLKSNIDDSRIRDSTYDHNFNNAKSQNKRRKKQQHDCTTQARDEL